MREKLVPSVFLMLVLLVGFPSSITDFSAFADKDDDKEKGKDKEKDRDDDNGNDKKENKNLKVSIEESKAYKKLKEKAEKAREKAEEKKDKLQEKYDKKIKELEEKAQKNEDNLKEKYEKQLEKFQEKVNRLDEEDDDDDNDNVTEFADSAEVNFSSNSGVTLCHFPPGNPDNAKTKTIGAPAARAHLAHGDTLGACGENIDLDLEERNYKLAKKQLKLEELRSKFEQKQIELAQKFSDKLEKLSAKIAEKQAKRAAKLLEKVESGEYYKDFIDEDTQLRKFVLSFDALDADPIGHSSEISEFSGSITLKTSSSTDTRGTTKFIVDECDLTNGDVSYSCEYGKARTTSSGPGGVKDSLVIIATLGGDDQEKRTGLKLSVSTGEDIRALEEGSFDVTILSPQSKITHEWFLGGDATMTVTIVTEGNNDT